MTTTCILSSVLWEVCEKFKQVFSDDCTAVLRALFCYTAVLSVTAV